MIIALNVGNTNVAYGYVRGGELGATSHVATPHADTEAAVEMLLDRLSGGRGDTDDGRVQLVVASVVPSLSTALREIAARRDFDLLEADEQTIPMPSRIDAATAGHDRLVNAYAAARLYGTPAIVVDLGTATTFDVVDASGAFVGGAIAPGIGLGLDALSARTAQLPRVAIALPPHALGRTTIEAIQSGTVLGHVGMVEFLVRAVSAELAVGGSTKPMVVLTGGLSAHAWAKAITNVDVVDPLLTLRGLALLHAEVRRGEPITGVSSVA